MEAHFKVLPEYRVQETSHAQERFIAGPVRSAVGSGRDAQSAEQAAAQMAFLAIKALLRGEGESREGNVGLSECTVVRFLMAEYRNPYTTVVLAMSADGKLLMSSARLVFLTS